VNDLAPAFANGIDCENYYENAADYCDFFEQMMRMVAATHLTTFANMQFTNQGR
jgi:phosphoribosyl 1,2-cyclic phosphodiesterase